MRCEKWLQTEKELQERIDIEPSVILFGNKSLVLILLRYYQKKQLSDRILGLSYEKTKKEQQGFLDKPVKPMESYEEEVTVFLVGNSQEQRERLLERVPENKRIVIVDYELLCTLSQKEHVDLDFLCVGFTKCGTTSLYQALKQNKQIYMPKEKEILYCNWKNEYLDAPERFFEMYFSRIPEKKRRGCIEPTYFHHANTVYESFGNKTKLIFMLRNPMDATYSYFKMMMRRSYEPQQRMYYKKYGSYCPEMFEEYMEDYIFSRKDQRFSYDIWLKEYLQFWKKEEIMVIFFEEIIKEPERILKEVQEFIGVQPKKIQELPYSNQGKQVARNYFSARVNGKLHKMAVNNKKEAGTKRKKAFRKLRLFVQKYTLVDNKERISAVDYRKLFAFYKDSIQVIENITGRSLKGIWYD